MTALGFGWGMRDLGGFSGVLVVNNHLPMQETPEKWVGSLGREDPLEVDRGVWWATVHGVARSWARLSMHTRTTWDLEPGPAALGHQGNP